MAYYVYLLASKKHGTLYLDVTRDIVRRVYEHRTKAVDSFTSRYGVDKLVWFEIYDDAATAIAREERTQEMATRLEDSFDRRAKSGVGRSLSRHLNLVSGDLENQRRHSAARASEPGIHNHRREYGFRARAKRRVPE